MKALDNTGIKDNLFKRGCNCQGYVPALNFAYDSSAKTVTVTDQTVFPVADFLQRINVLVHDESGNTKAGTIAVTKGGSGYTSAPTVVLTGGGGSGAAATAVITNGVVTAVNVTAGGTGYTSAPTISFTGGGGSGAAATSALTGGAVSAITLTPGSVVIDVATLTLNKPIHITATVVSNAGCKSDGTARNIGASGAFGNWSQNWIPELAG
jgi:hypothetical protein